MKQLYLILLTKWKAECPLFWAHFQKVCFVVGGSSALMTGEFKAMMPLWIFPILSGAAFLGAFISQFTTIKNESV